MFLTLFYQNWAVTITPVATAMTGCAVYWIRELPADWIMTEFSAVNLDKQMLCYLRLEKGADRPADTPNPGVGNSLPAGICSPREIVLSGPQDNL